jgi:MraZ protein
LLRGTSSINLDAKGRLAVPTRYRAELHESCENQMVITVAIDERCVGLSGCLWLYPLYEWEKLEEKIVDLPSTNIAAGKLRRFLIGNANECEMDGQGRLLLPEKLRQLAKLEKHVVLSGQLNKFEIWNEEIWNAIHQEMMDGDDLDGLEELSHISF